MGWIISGITVVAISIVLTYVAKRMGVTVGEMKTKDIAWYLYGNILSQGTYVLEVCANVEGILFFVNIFFRIGFKGATYRAITRRS
jgi:hypothetical protein